MIYIKKGALIKQIDESLLEKYKANGFSKIDSKVVAIEQAKTAEGEKIEYPHCEKVYKKPEYLEAHIKKVHSNGVGDNVQNL